MINRIAGLALLAAGLVVGVVGSQLVGGTPSAAADAKPAVRYFEMRTYTAADGKLDELHKRFREHTNALFVKHGMELVGYWTPAEGEEAKNTLVYILAYPDKASREKSWKDFQDDADWKSAKAASEVNGKLVTKVESKFLVPTDYSPIK